MSCLTAGKIAEIQAQIVKLKAQLTVAQTALTSALVEIEEYRFDSGVGSQRVRYRDPNKIQKTISHLEAQIDNLERRLTGKGISALNLRRKSGY